MYKNKRSFFALLTVSILFSFALPAQSAEKKASEEKVAAVNGSVITVNDFNRDFNLAKERLSQMGSFVSESQLPELKKRVLDNLIDLEVLYQESQKAGIKADEQAVAKQFQSFKSGFPGDAEINEWFKKMNTSETDIKAQITRQMAIYQLIETQVVANIIISDEESMAYYNSHPEISKQSEQVRASHILIKIEPGADESKKAEARKEIEEIQKKVKKGEDFGALAKESSACPSAAKEGDLGYFTRGRMVKPFEDAVFALKPGEVSGIVETQFGYHLIKSVDKKAEMTIPYEDVKKDIETILKREKINKGAVVYIDKLKEKAKIETFLAEDKL
ncbi:MAG: peptidylprolyl isomerase [Deltaproteobacteria bacterium]|nr:peptidylprolyl isomerase [Deltaproteobacteria bacterium]